MENPVARVLAVAVTSDVFVERIVLLLIGLVVGGLLGWLLKAIRTVTHDPRLEQELRGRLAGVESENGRLRDVAASEGARAAAAEASRVAAEREASSLRETTAGASAKAEAALADASAVRAALAGATAEVEAARRSLEDQRRFHEDRERELRDSQAGMVAELRAEHARALAGLKDAFAGLSAEALRRTGPEFLRLANETMAKFQEAAKGDLAAREQRIETLVKPLEEHLKSYQQRLQQAEAAQATALGDVRRHLEVLASHSHMLSNETQRLRVVLSSNQARGRWGEETLRRVVEASGMSAHCDFVEQVREGDAKPDLVVRLPGERVIIVDSKVPDLDFLGSLDAGDEQRRSAALAEHAGKMRLTIKSLAERDYPGQFPNALDHVVLFVPAESLFSAALEGDHDLIVWAAERRILLATPASLIALLRSVAVSWQHHEQSRNAREIAEAARSLYERVVKFTEHFERIRDGLLKANKAYDEAVGSFERMVRPGGERLLKIGGGVESKVLPEIRPLDASLRPPPSEG